MSPLARYPIAVVTALLSLTAPASVAQEAPEGPVIKLEAFNVSVYNGKIRIIDGFTGKTYEGSNGAVIGFAQTFNRLLLNFHKKLVNDEVRHLEMRDRLGKDFERQMQQLTTSFGLGKFSLDNSTWLQRERSIITRLVREPFFEINALVVWDLDRLNQSAPARPKSKFATDIRYDAENGRWERRMTAKWEVYFYRKDEGDFYTAKSQGLNLDTQRGYHFIDWGLAVDVPPEAFKKVSLTYPIFYSNERTGKDEVRRLQELFVTNLHYVYDPFSWVYRRNLRFRGGFAQECLDHIKDQELPITDRDWFDPVLSRFLSDVIISKLQGPREIYSFHMQNKRWSESPRSLGVGLDLLNWNKDEEREAKDVPEAMAQLSLGSPSGFRFVMLDAYQRFGDTLIERIRSRLAEQREAKQAANGRNLLTKVIEELAAMPYAEFAERAKATQEANLNQFRVTRPTS